MFEKEEINPYLNQKFDGFYAKDYQLYAQNVFQMKSNELRYFILDFNMGSGKTLTALNILKQFEGRYIIVGNEASQNSFYNDIKKIDIDPARFQYITIQKVALLDDLDLLTFFQDSYIIIDEFQNLYSQAGLNSYGEAFKKVFKHLLKTIKVICLSGTLFNGKAEEINYILDIFQEKISQNLDDNIATLAKHVISYNAIQKSMAQKQFMIQGPDIVKDSEIKLIRCEMGKDQYEAYLQTTSDSAGLLSTSKYILPKYFYDGEKHISNKILTGYTVQKENLKKCSPLGYNFINYLQNILLKEKCKKTVAYIDNIVSQFGLYQYIQILLENGWIQYGRNPNSKTLCAICGKILSDHKKEDKKHYMPSCFGIYSNEVTKKTREKYTQIFNSYDNRYGQLMQFMFLTQIAQTGLSLKCVSHFFILDNMSQISIYNQIVARAIRFQGHMDLHEEDRIVKIYNLVVSAPGYKEITKHEQKWIDIIKDDLAIQDLYKKMRKLDYQKEQTGKVLQSQFQQMELIKLIIYYIKQLNLQTIKKDELKKIILNQHLMPIGINIKESGIDVEQIIYQTYETTKDNMCIKRNIDLSAFQYQHDQLNKYDLFYRSRVQEYPSINYNDYKEIQLTKIVENNIFTQLNLTNNVYNLRYYIKSFMLQNVNLKDEFYRYRNFASYMIYDNSVYIENDEKQYIKNHYNLFSEIYDKTIYYVMENIFKLITKYKIKGFYQKSEVIAKGLKKEIKLVNKFPEVEKTVQFVTSSSLPQYKYIQNQVLKDCFVQQPLFYDFFKDEKFIKMNKYEELIQLNKCRTLLLYALKTDTLQLPDFILIDK